MATQAFNPGSPGVAAGPGAHAVAITKSDTTVYTPPLKSLWVTTTGDIAIIPAGDTTAVTIAAVPVGWFQTPVMISKVMSTNTTAIISLGFF